MKQQTEQAVQKKQFDQTPLDKKNKGILIVISGPSGAGKGTVCSLVRNQLPDLKVSVSETTRQPRDGEIDGVNYTFVTKELFEERIQSGHYLEYAQVYENYYGTPKENVEKILNQGYDVILEIDIQGAMNVKKNMEDAVFIFIAPPSLEELKKRLMGRGTESEEQLQIRLKSAAEEIRQIPNYDYVVINEDNEEKKAAHQIEMIIASEHNRKEHLGDIVEEILRR